MTLAAAAGRRALVEEDQRLQQLIERVRSAFALAEASEQPQSLPEEVEEGNVEYKLQLLDPAPDRVKHLTTQLHWRLNEGSGTAFYEIGVRDNGEAIGICQQSMIKSLQTLFGMCQVMPAELSIVRFRDGFEPQLKSVRMQVTRTLEKHAKKQLRVSVIGAFASGKSTLIGVLTRGCLDDGNGLARMQVFRHRHEIENGRTSSISEHTIGITPDGRFSCADGFEDCDFREEEDVEDVKHLLTFSDLAGHKKYLKITASGLASQFPDYVLLVVDSTQGVEGMTREHIKIATALEVAVFVVLTKTDAATSMRIRQTIDEVTDLLRSCCPEKHVVCIQSENDLCTHNESVIPLFRVSSVSGNGLDLLQGYLAALEPKRIWASQSSIAAEFQINKAYDIEDAGTIVTGLMQSGTISVGETMLLGPDGRGNFCEIVVDNIEVQRKPAENLSAGEAGAILISFPTRADMSASLVRKGMMLIHSSARPEASLQFDAEVRFLLDSPIIRENYQAVIHAGQVRQMAKLVHVGGSISVDPSATTESQLHRKICRFEFMYWPEYLRPDLPLVLLDGNAHGVGKVVRAVTASEHIPRVCTF